jgi:sec-independent protein translocase protein TatA
MMPRGTELLIIFLVILLLFGATRLPQLGASLGSAIRNFKKGFSTDDETRPDDKDKKDQAALASSANASPGTEAAGAKAGAGREG